VGILGVGEQVTQVWLVFLLALGGKTALDDMMSFTYLHFRFSSCAYHAAYSTVPVALHDKLLILGTVFELVLGDTTKSRFLVFKVSAHT